jgi:hypothetical protein
MRPVQSTQAISGPVLYSDKPVVAHLPLRPVQSGHLDIGSGAIVSGRIASGQVGNVHIASGSVTSGRLGVTGTPDGTLFLRDDFTWAAAGGGVTSGGIGSGKIASGTVQGFYGTTRHIASGTIGSFDFAPNAITSGHINIAGTPDGTLFLRDDFTWAAAGGGVTSGGIGSGK